MATNGIRPLLSELIGTGALVFVGAGAAALGSGGLLGVALAHGLIVLGLIHTFGHVSGTQINPAVTLGIWAAGLMLFTVLIRITIPVLAGRLTIDTRYYRGRGAPVAPAGGPGDEGAAVSDRKETP